jgi:hypothetical protein
MVGIAGHVSSGEAPSRPSCQINFLSRNRKVECEVVEAAAFERPLL